MKLRIVILIAALSVLFGCKKNDPTSANIGDPPDIYIVGLKNNVDWAGSPKANAIGADSVMIQGSGMFDVLQVKFKLNGVGQYTLSSLDAQNLYWIFGEVIIRAKYSLRTDVSSTVNVTAYNATSKIVEGTFVIHMTRVSGSDNTTPQNLDFLSGKFRAQLVN